jgi:hypothetical protein
MLWRRDPKSGKRKQEASALDRFHGDLEVVVSTIAADSPYSSDLESPLPADSAAQHAPHVELKRPEPGNESSEVDSELEWLRSQVHREVVNKLDLTSIGTLNEDDLRIEIRRNAESSLEEHGADLSAAQKEALINDVIDEVLGSGRWSRCSETMTSLTS